MLDIEQPDQLIDYLRSTRRIVPGESPEIRVLQGGVSNRTVLVERDNGESWVLKQALEKLRVAVDWYSSPQRIHREALGLRWLTELAPPGTLPEFVFEDHKVHLLAMAAVPQPHENWKVMLLSGRLDINHVIQFARLLGTIHCRSWERAEEVSSAFDDRSFFESLRLEPYYAYTAEQVPAARSFIAALIADTRAIRLTLVHGDYSPKNILVYQDRLILLDHEVIHFGDPAFDLGFSLTHLLSKAHHMPDQRSAFRDAVLLYWAEYQKFVRLLPWSEDLEPRAVRHTLACLLARAAGRSPLEYLDQAARARQREAVLALQSDPPGAIADLADAFLTRLP